MQRGAHHELAHVAAAREPVQLRHPFAGFGRGGGDLDAGQRIQAVAVHPDVGVGHAHGAHGGVAQARQRRVALAGHVEHEPLGAGGHRLPARVAEAAAQRERVLEQPGRPIGVVLAQRRLGPQRLWERLERHPALPLHQRERVVEYLHRVRQLAAQQPRAAEDRQRPRRLAEVPAAACGVGRLAQQRDRRLVVRPVRQRHAAHAKHRRALMGVARQAGGPPQPPPRRRRPSGLHLDEPEFPAHLARRLPFAGRLSRRERLVQHRGALLVAPANGMHQSDPERGQRAGEQPWICYPARLRARLTQTRHTRLDSARSHRRAPRLKLTDRGRSITAARLAPAVMLAGRPAHARIRRAPQLAAKQHLAGVGVMTRRADLARPRQATHQQLMRTLVERVQRNRPRGQRGTVKSITARQRSQRRIPQHRFTHPRQAPTLHQQPRLKDRPRSRIDPFQQLAAHQPGIGIAARQREHINHRPARQPQLQRIRPQRLGNPERAAQLRQRPTQRPERIISLAEHQPSQPHPRHRPLSQHQIRQNSPRLMPARWRPNHTVTLDLRAPQQANHEPRHGIPDRRPPTRPPKTPPSATNSRPGRSRPPGKHDA